jgi:hypothetical protein
LDNHINELYDTPLSEEKTMVGEKPYARTDARERTLSFRLTKNVFCPLCFLSLSQPNGVLPHDNLVFIEMCPDEQGRFGFNVKGGLDQKMPVIVSRVAPGTAVRVLYYLGHRHCQTPELLK